MAKALHIQVDDKDLRQALSVAPERVISGMNTSLRRIAVFTQRAFREEEPVGATGQLRQSTNFHFNNRLSVRVEPEAKYADYVEKGTKPHWTSVRNLERWANLKGINPYALQHSIATHGTKAHPFEEKVYRRAVEFATQDMQNQLNKTIRETI